MGWPNLILDGRTLNRRKNYFTSGKLEIMVLESIRQHHDIPNKRKLKAAYRYIAATLGLFFTALVSMNVWFLLSGFQSDVLVNNISKVLILSFVVNGHLIPFIPASFTLAIRPRLDYAINLCLVIAVYYLSIAGIDILFNIQHITATVYGIGGIVWGAAYLVLNWLYNSDLQNHRKASIFLSFGWGLVILLLGGMLEYYSVDLMAILSTHWAVRVLIWLLVVGIFPLFIVFTAVSYNPEWNDAKVLNIAVSILVILASLVEYILGAVGVNMIHGTPLINLGIGIFAFAGFLHAYYNIDQGEPFIPEF